MFPAASLRSPEDEMQRDLIKPSRCSHRLSSVSQINTPLLMLPSFHRSDSALLIEGLLYAAILREGCLAPAWTVPALQSTPGWQEIMFTVATESEGFSVLAVLLPELPVNFHVLGPGRPASLIASSQARSPSILNNLPAPPARAFRLFSTEHRAILCFFF